MNCLAAHAIYIVTIVALIARIEWQRAEKRILVGQLDRARKMLEYVRAEVEGMADD